MFTDIFKGLEMFVDCLHDTVHNTCIGNKIMNDKTGRYKYVGRNQSGYETYLDTKTGETYNRHHDM